MSDASERNPRRFFEGSASEVASRLRAMADQVESEAGPKGMYSDRPVLAAATIVHSIQWGVANLPLNQLIRNADEVGLMEAEEGALNSAV